MSRRTQQVGEFLREEISDIIRKEVDDPRVGFVSVTDVEVTDDLRSAKVYVSVLGTEEERKATLTALRSAAPFIRRHLAPRLRTRNIPELDFRDDRSMEHAELIARTLRRLHAEEAQQPAVAPEGRPPDDSTGTPVGETVPAPAEEPTE
jgi:ribosome-binding factor A